MKLLTLILLTLIYLYTDNEVSNMDKLKDLKYYNTGEIHAQ